MAEGLPYYKLMTSDYLQGDIQICRDKTIVCYNNLCASYWEKLGEMSVEFAMMKLLRKDKSILNELIEKKCIEIDEKNNKIKINSLDIQLNDAKGTSEKRRKAARKRWSNEQGRQVEKNKDDTSVMQVHKNSNANRIEYSRIEQSNTSKEVISAPKFNFKKSLIDYGFKKSLVEEWIGVRRKKKATNSKTAYNKFITEIEKCGFDKNKILEHIVVNSWSGFSASWDLSDLKDSEVKNKTTGIYEHNFNASQNMENLIDKMNLNDE